ncbi:MAG TPA: hypothetical protein VFF69_06470 [Phycisphaerales bacterium]|nr:hypothetical protein [Phycisphaerales bacterium]
MEPQSLNLSDFNPRILLDGEEVAVSFGGREVWRLHWSDVVEVAIWKDECSGGQPLCLGLRTHAMKPGEYFGVNDSATGFQEALDEIDRRFDAAYSHKWREAVFPPMATQWAVVYGSPSGRAECAQVVWPEAA